MAVKEIPVIERQVGVQRTEEPSLQGAYQELAVSSNSLSAIGAKVTQSASNTMAQRLGYETGKNPRGDLLPPLTEFDKNFSDSYHQQAAATLSTQAEKLLDNTQIQMAKAPRLTPQLIAQTNKQLQEGLSKIAENAPTAIKGKLEESFNDSMMQQNKHYQTKMISQQREDQKNSLENGIAINHKKAYELAMSGDIKGSQAAAESAARMADSALANHFITPEAARVAKDTAKQNHLNGLYVSQFMQADKEGKRAEFEKDFAKGPPNGMTYEQWTNVGHAIVQQDNFVTRLRAENENLEIAKFKTRLELGANTITPTEIQTVMSNISNQTTKEELHLLYLKKLNTANKTQIAVDNILKNPLNPTVLATASTENLNKAFELAVENRMEESKKQGQALSREDAEVEAARSFGRAIPSFTESVNLKMSSQNPNMIEAGAKQILALQQSGAGQALNGVTKESKAMYAGFRAIRNSLDPNKAAQILHDNIYNPVAEVVDQKWAMRLKKIPSGQPHEIFALKLTALNPAKMLNPTVYGNDILREYQEYYKMLNGDDVTAQQLIKESVKQNYGDSMINGQRQTVYHPIEKVLNLPDNAIPVVQLDIAEQMQSKLEKTKKDYDEGKINEYWELTSRHNIQDMVKQKESFYSPKLNKEKISPTLGNLNPAINENPEINIHPEATLKSTLKANVDIEHGSAIEIRKHLRNGKVEKYNLVLQMNPFSGKSDDPAHPINGGWDISIVSKEKGMLPLIREAPYLGLITYNPDIAKIRSNYVKLHPFKA
jgi:hypothetical protein